jgi:hypothetical protein
MIADSLRRDPTGQSLLDVTQTLLKNLITKRQRVILVDSIYKNIYNFRQNINFIVIVYNCVCTGNGE